MKKYLAVASNSIKTSLAYRANNLIMVFSVFFSFLVVFYFWTAIYNQGNQIGTYSLNEIVSYYIFITIYELTVTADGTAWTIGEAIKNGQISNYILKPIVFINYKLAQSLGGLLYRIVLFAMPTILALFLLRNFLILPSSNLLIYFGIILSFILSYLLYFLIYFSVGMTGFWVANPHSFFFTCYVIISFMQGQWLPLDLLGNWFMLLSKYLPFQYLFFVPISLATNRIPFSISMLIVPLGWCMGLYFTGYILNKKGLKKYEGYGI